MCVFSVPFLATRSFHIGPLNTKNKMCLVLVHLRARRSINHSLCGPSWARIRWATLEINSETMHKMLNACIHGENDPAGVHHLEGFPPPHSALQSHPLLFTSWPTVCGHLDSICHVVSACATFGAAHRDRFQPFGVCPPLTFAFPSKSHLDARGSPRGLLCDRLLTRCTAEHSAVKRTEFDYGSKNWELIRQWRTFLLSSKAKKNNMCVERMLPTCKLAHSFAQQLDQKNTLSHFPQSFTCTHHVNVWMGGRVQLSNHMRFFSRSSDQDRETHLEVSTPSVVLIELAPDSHRNATQIAPNGKRVAP